VQKSRDDSEVTDHEKMNHFFQQNKLVKLCWLAAHRQWPFNALRSQVLQIWWTNGHQTSFYPLCSLSTCIGWVKHFQKIWK